MSKKRRPCSAPGKMDSARALGIMGFSSTRWMDASTGMDPKEALDKALSDQMMNIAQKKKVAAKERKEIEKGFGEESSRTAKARTKEEKYAEEFRTLHEAYQFLLKKYNNSPRVRSLESATEDFGRTHSSEDFFSREQQLKTQSEIQTQNQSEKRVRKDSEKQIKKEPSETEVDNVMEHSGQDENTNLEY